MKESKAMEWQYKSENVKFTKRKMSFNSVECDSSSTAIRYDFEFIERDVSMKNSTNEIAFLLSSDK